MEITTVLLDPGFVSENSLPVSARWLILKVFFFVLFCFNVYNYSGLSLVIFVIAKDSIGFSS